MRELKITPIKNGTVIDHIGNGIALEVLKIIGVSELDKDSTVSVALHVRSQKIGWKDIVKVENMELSPSEGQRDRAHRADGDDRDHPRLQGPREAGRRPARPDHRASSGARTRTASRTSTSRSRASSTSPGGGPSSSDASTASGSSTSSSPASRRPVRPDGRRPGRRVRHRLRDHRRLRADRPDQLRPHRPRARSTGPCRSGPAPRAPSLVTTDLAVVDRGGAPRRPSTATSVYLRLGGGIFLLAYAGYLFFVPEHRAPPARPGARRSTTAFLLILLLELGDTTMVLTIIFVERRSRTCSSSASRRRSPSSCVAGSAAMIGSRLGERVEPALLERIVVVILVDRRRRYDRLRPRPGRSSVRRRLGPRRRRAARSRTGAPSDARRPRATRRIDGAPRPRPPRSATARSTRSATSSRPSPDLEGGEAEGGLPEQHRRYGARGTVGDRREAVPRPRERPATARGSGPRGPRGGRGRRPAA